MRRIRKQVYYILEDQDADSPAAHIVEFGLATLISVNILGVILGTVPSLAPYKPHFSLFERLSVTIFTLEYLLRIWCIGERVERPIVGRLKFALQPLMIIDLIALAPSFSAGKVDLRFARAFRLIRILKLTRHSRALTLIVEVLRRNREELFSTAFISGLLLIMSSGLIYYAEHPTQPEVFSSIPESMWWAVMTMTTVGYGDVTPVTPLGKIIGMIVALIGVAFVALPAGILASGFTEVIRERKNKNNNK